MRIHGKPFGEAGLRSQSTWRMVLTALLIVIDQPCVCAAPQDNSFSIFIRPDVFAQFCDAMRLSEPQRHAADASYEVYAESMRCLSDQFVTSIRGIHDSVGGQSEHGTTIAPTGDRATRPEPPKALPPDQSLEIIERSHGIRRKALRDARSLEKDLMEAIAHLLSDSQNQLLPAAVNSMRRNVVLRAPMDHRLMVIDLPDAVPDLYKLVEDASNDGGELAKYFQDGGAPVSTSVAVRKAVDSAMEQFGQEFSAAIEHAEERQIERSRELVRAHAARDFEARHDIERLAYEDWRRKYDSVDRAARNIASVLQSHEDFAGGDAWLDRVNACWFPTIFQRESSEALYDWFIQQEPSPELKHAANAIMSDYFSSRRYLRNLTMHAVMQSRESAHDAFLKPERRTALQEKLDDLRARRRELCNRTNAAVRSLLLDANTKRSFDDQLIQFRSTQRPTMRQEPL